MEKPIVGHIYYISDFTAPKFFNGLYFECVLTDQKIYNAKRIVEDLGHINDYKHEIWKPERLNKTK